MPDLLEERFARAQRDARARAERLRARVLALARLLRSHGARRVILFGSLAPNKEPHAGTDALGIEGLEEATLASVVFEVEEVAGGSVDLVRLEAASPRLRARIEEDGVEVEG